MATAIVLFVAEHVWILGILWLALSVAGLWIKLLNQRFLVMGNLCLALMFGPFYFAAQAMEWNAVILELPRRKQ